jgi:glycosyltransferase involved in cell wall biosynthesis
MTRVGFLSTFPPTRCGLATFTESLSSAMGSGSQLQPTVVRVLAEGEMSAESGSAFDARVGGQLVTGDRRSFANAAAVLNGCDAAVIQHEYGIYGGRDGEDIVELMEMLSVPSIVVLHTVLPTPTAHQRLVLEAVCDRAAAVVVMTEHARITLLTGLPVAPQKVHVIPHGARVGGNVAQAAERPLSRHLLTWGLISPGKGLEWGIRAVSELARAGRDVDYVIAGQTHPKLLASQGESYRHSLQSLVGELHVQDRVHFVDRYLDRASLDELLRSSLAVVLPYESTDQATSGVLVEAVGARVPVIATDFPHAVELLSDNPGVVVPHRDAAAIAAAVAKIIDDPRSFAAGRFGGLGAASGLSWQAVAARYASMIGGLVAEQAA